MASLEAAIALKILSGHSADVDRQLTIIDAWDGTFRTMNVVSMKDQVNCPACDDGERLWLNGLTASGSTVLCGRNAVQVTPAEKLSISLDELAARLESAGQVSSNPFLMRVALSEEDVEISVFPDGRAIIRGTEDVTVARGIYSRYIGG